VSGGAGDLLSKLFSLGNAQYDAEGFDFSPKLFFPPFVADHSSIRFPWLISAVSRLAGVLDVKMLQLTATAP